ncbi:alpha-crystallin A chain [Papilio machaon]|uniref:alpha-crystallin A chain n=1 Tax=Papilio machaon TaxID=76193 RepID=UPI001E664716|nr:alpha-crystallin A chain [Papilio machaon]
MASLLPLLLGLEAPRLPHHHHVALALAPEVFGVLSQPQDYYSSWNQLATMLQDASSTLKTDKNKFQVHLDVQDFAPEDITVKTCDGFVVVEGKHEERQDEHGWVSRHFRGRYALPRDCDAGAVKSRLSSDGVLTVTASLPTKAAAERQVPVVLTGPVRNKSKSAQGPLGDGGTPATLEATIENGQ